MNKKKLGGGGGKEANRLYTSENTWRDITRCKFPTKEFGKTGEKFQGILR